MRLRLSAKPSTAERRQTLCAVQTLSGFPQRSFPAHKRAISRTPHTKLPFCTVEVFARPAHVWADKRVFNLFLHSRLPVLPDLWSLSLSDICDRRCTPPCFQQYCPFFVLLISFFLSPGTTEELFLLLVWFLVHLSQNIQSILLCFRKPLPEVFQRPDVRSNIHPVRTRNKFPLICDALSDTHIPCI